MKKGPILDKTKKTRKHHAWCSRNRQICRVTLKSISESLEPSKFVKTAAFNWFICSFFSVFWVKKKKNSTLKTMKLNSLNQQWLKASLHPERCQKDKLAIR